MTTKLNLKDEFYPEGTNCYIGYEGNHENAQALFYSTAGLSAFTDASVKSGDCDDLIAKINNFPTISVFGEPTCVMTDYAFFAAEAYLTTRIATDLTYSDYARIQKESSSDAVKAAQEQCGQEDGLVKMVELFQTTNAKCVAYEPLSDKVAYLDGDNLVVVSDFVISSQEAYECIGKIMNNADGAADL